MTTALFPFVAPNEYRQVSPSAYLDNEWTRPQGLANIDALVEYMAARYPVDTTAVNAPDLLKTLLPP